MKILVEGVHTYSYGCGLDQVIKNLNRLFSLTELELVTTSFTPPILDTTR